MGDFAGGCGVVAASVRPAESVAISGIVSESRGRTGVGTEGQSMLSGTMSPGSPDHRITGSLDDADWEPTSPEQPTEKRRAKR